MAELHGVELVEVPKAKMPGHRRDSAERDKALEGLLPRGLVRCLGRGQMRCCCYAVPTSPAATARAQGTRETGSDSPVEGAGAGAGGTSQGSARPVV